MTLQASWFGRSAIILSGAILMISVALMNGYPLVYSDTGTYLRSAFTGFVPPDRPYWYGLFIELTSLGGYSLWGVVLVQALLCSFLLWRCWMVFGDGRAWTYLVTVAVLSPFTGLGWYTSQLVADIFTVIGVLAGVLLLFTNTSFWWRSLYGSILVMACFVHLSNLMILPLTLISTTLITRWKAGMRTSIPLWIPLATLLLCWPAIWLANKAVSGEGHISQRSHVFLMSGMAESGILQQWLAEHCPDESLGICHFKDSIPTTNKAFMWSERSPLHWGGGADKVRDEYTRIIRSTLKDPRYIALHIKASLWSTARLLALWHVADELEGEYYRQDYSSPYGSIAGLVAHELDDFLASEQNTGNGKLWMRVIDPVYAFLLGASILLAIYLLIRRSKNTYVLICLLTGITTLVFGAWVCATLSTVDSRFMGRTAWLLPMMVSLILWRLQAQRKAA